MRITIPKLLLIAALCCLGSQEAAARRLHFFSIPTGETVVLAKELPDISALKRDDGSYVDLGYHFTTLGGEWVGYVGSSSKYLKLNDDQLNALLKVGGMSSVPKIPDKPIGAKMGTGTLYVLFAFGIIGLLAKFGLLPKRRERAPKFQPAPQANYADTSSAEPQSALMAKMMEAAEKHQAAVASGSYAPQASGSFASSAPINRGSGPATFGKRT